MRRGIVIVGFLLIVQCLLAHSLTVTSDLREIQYSVVLAQYKNQFGKWEMPGRDESFPYSLIRVHVDGNGTEVAKAKQILSIDMGLSHRVQDLYKGEDNEIWFLVPSGARNFYIKCGDGCDKVLLYEGHLKTNVAYMCHVHFTVDQELGPEMPQSQYLTFHISPASAILKVNGEQWHVGKDGEATRFVSFGKYDYTIEAGDYHSHSGSVIVNSAESKKDVTIQLSPAFGFLSIEATAELKGASVYVDNKYVGDVPISAYQLSSGAHTLLISRQSYKSITEQITIQDGEIYQPHLILEANFTQVTLSVDNNAELWCENRVLGSGKWTGALEYGEHVIEARLRHHEPSVQTITVAPQMTNTTFNIATPKPINGSLRLESTPSEASVLIDGVDKGKTPLFIPQILIGEHKLVLKKGDSYADVDTTVTIKKNEMTTVNIALRDQNYVTLSAVNSNAGIYILDTKTNAYKFLGTGTWRGSLPVGKQQFKTIGTSSQEDAFTTLIIGNKTSYTLNSPKDQMGQLQVKTRPRDANIFVDGTLVQACCSLKIGQHNVIVTHGNYKQQSRKVDINRNATTRETFHLERYIGWLHPDDHPDHYFETQYGLGVSLHRDEYNNRQLNHYVGLTYGYLPERFGIYVTPMYGVTSKEIVLTAGPSMRLTNEGCALSLNWLLGGGGLYNLDRKKFDWAAETGLQFGFESEDNFGWYSFSMGCKYFDNQVIPTFGLSMMPIQGLMFMAEEYQDFPHWRMEFMGSYGFKNGDMKAGFNLSWTPSFLGAYGAAMFGPWSDSYSLSAGPTIRLIPDDIPFDLQLYQGIGWYRTSGEDLLGGETGLRFAFENRNEGDFGWWSFNVGAEYGQDGYVGINFGLSVGIIGILSTCGLAALFL